MQFSQGHVPVFYISHFPDSQRLLMFSLIFFQLSWLSLSGKTHLAQEHSCQGKEREDETASHKGGITHVQSVMTVLKMHLKTMAAPSLLCYCFLQQRAPLLANKSQNPTVKWLCFFFHKYHKKYTKKLWKILTKTANSKEILHPRLLSCSSWKYEETLKAFNQHWSVYHRTGIQQWSSASRIECFPLIHSNSPHLLFQFLVHF